MRALRGENNFLYVDAAPLSFVDVNGLEKLSLFAPADFAFQSATARDPDIPGTLIIYGHGNERDIADQWNGTTIRLTPKDLAALIKKTGIWKPGMPVIVKACNVASNDCTRGGRGIWCFPSFTQLLADELGVPVTGPNGYYEIKPTLRPNEYGFSGLYSWVWGGFTGEPRDWITHIPRQTK